MLIVLSNLLVHMGAYTHVHIHIYTQTWMHTCENVGTHAKSFSYVVICTSEHTVFVYEEWLIDLPASITTEKD
jgi:hypothetical protein